jgi:hypothetical protein
MAGVAITRSGVEGPQQRRHGWAGRRTQLAETPGRILTADQVVIALQEPGEHAGGKRRGPALPAGIPLSAESVLTPFELPDQPLHRGTFGGAMTRHQADQDGRNGQP